ncbi:MAG: FAD-dependent oxidoreductase [Chloroflexi bacterium]|nr:FAD-dependent oxidoreductase [Chloroflexota bacterium]
MTSCAFEELFREGSIGLLQLKNRLVMGPMGTDLSDEKGLVTRKLIDYYQARARGGVGLIIVQAALVSPEGRVNRHQLTIFDDETIPGLTELAQTIHASGAKAAIQLGHGGRLCRSSISGFQPVAPSAIQLRGYDTPRDLSVDEIRELVNRYVRAAERARAAGFDGLEIHASGRYLVCSFLSASSNRREDSYGGPLENRARFLLEIIKSIKERLGSDFSVWYRACVEEIGVENGITLEEAKAVARMAENAGIDAIDVHASGPWSRAVPPMGSQWGVLLPYAAEMKKTVSIPVMAGIRMTPALGEKAIVDKSLDFVVLGRALIADPSLPMKIEEGHEDAVRPCIACMHCIDQTMSGGELRCTVNAEVGREREYVVLPAKRKKRVAVIGGGPAGLEAARVLALRGHDVSLIEKTEELGGKMIIASRPPGKEELNGFTEYLLREINRLGVKVVLQQETYPASTSLEGFDAAVIATGSNPLRPPLKGIEGDNILSAEDALTEAVSLGSKIAVIGGGLVGCETAMFLASQGKKVIIVEMQEKLALDVAPISRKLLLDKLSSYDIATFTGEKAIEITPHGLVVGNQAGEKRTITVDNVVLAVGYKSENALYQALQESIPEVYLAGDSLKPCRIVNAVEDGHRIGVMI